MDSISLRHGASWGLGSLQLCVCIYVFVRARAHVLVHVHVGWNHIKEGICLLWSWSLLRRGREGVSGCTDEGSAALPETSVQFPLPGEWRLPCWTLPDVRLPNAARCCNTFCQSLIANMVGARPVCCWSSPSILEV